MFILNTYIVHVYKFALTLCYRFLIYCSPTGIFFRRIRPPSIFYTSLVFTRHVITLAVTVHAMFTQDGLTSKQKNQAVGIISSLYDICIIFTCNGATTTIHVHVSVLDNLFLKHYLSHVRSFYKHIYNSVCFICCNKFCA